VTWDTVDWLRSITKLPVVASITRDLVVITAPDRYRPGPPRLPERRRACSRPSRRVEQRGQIFARDEVYHERQPRRVADRLVADGARDVIGAKIRGLLRLGDREVRAPDRVRFLGRAAAADELDRTDAGRDL
jgi:hypothetical protein